MIEEKEYKKQLPTKEFLMAQIEACKATIQQNQGALNLCLSMIKNGCYVGEEKQEI